MSDHLYLVKRTFVDLKTDPVGATQKVDIRATYTDLQKAKAAAKAALLEEGYEKDGFAVYQVRKPEAEWKHPDGTFVYAKVSDEAIFTVAIETTPNTLNLEGNKDGKVEGELFHVIQTTIHYDRDRSGASQETNVDGTFRNYEHAKMAALCTLLDEDVAKEGFTEYHEFSDQEDWAFGEDVLVHAVAENGENFLVSILKQA